MNNLIIGGTIFLSNYIDTLWSKDIKYKIIYLAGYEKKSNNQLTTLVILVWASCFSIYLDL
jgi:hypothetical protein